MKITELSNLPPPVKMTKKWLQGVENAMKYDYSKILKELKNEKPNTDNHNDSHNNND